MFQSVLTQPLSIRLVCLLSFHLNFSFLTGTPEDLLEINQEMEEVSHFKSTRSPFATQRHNDETNRNSEEDADHLSTDDPLTNADKHSSVQSLSSLRSTVVSQSNQRSSQRSATSSCEGAVPAGSMGLASSRGRLSSCSTVMITEEQLMLNPVKPEVGGKHMHIYFSV